MASVISPRDLASKLTKGPRNPTEVFDLLEKLGEGSYGTVHKGIHRETGQVVAIKIIPVQDMDIEDTIKEISFMKEFCSEHVVQYYGKYYYHDNVWIVIEYCGGGSIQDILRILGPLEEHCIAAVCKYTLLGLKYLHELGKMHRDIKAGNILLTDDGQPKLADFGVSGQLSAELTKRHTVIGTPFWMAPEVIQEVGYDQMADVWSLGITLIELAERKPPHSDIHPMRALFVIPQQPPPTLKNVEKWSPEFSDFLEKCLQKSPSDRWHPSKLLNHPFVSRIKNFSSLGELLERCREASANYPDEEEEPELETPGDSAGEEEEEPSFLQDSGGEEEEDGEGGGFDEFDSGTMLGYDAGTTVVRDDDDDYDAATTVVNRGDDDDVNDMFGDEFSSTMVVGGAGGDDEDDEGSTFVPQSEQEKPSSYVPDFMVKMKEQEASDAAAAKRKQEYIAKTKKNDYLTFSLEELQALITRRRELFEKQCDENRSKHLASIREINFKHEAISRPILQAIDHKLRESEPTSSSQVFRP